MQHHKILYIFIILYCYIIAPIHANAIESHTSEYVGQEKRAIKSLSIDDIAALQRGDGWGLAKAAELNGKAKHSHKIKYSRKIYCE